MKITFIFFLISSSLFSQVSDDYSKFTTFQKQVVLDTAVFPYPPLFKLCNDKFYVIQSDYSNREKDGSGNTKVLFNVTDSTQLLLETDSYLLKNHFWDYVISSENVFLLIGSKVYVYEIPNSIESKFNTKLLIKHQFEVESNKLEMLNDSTLLLFTGRIFGDMHKKEYFYYQTFDVKKQKLSPKRKFRFSKGFIYASYLPCKIHSVMKGSLYVADLTNYKVYEIDIFTGAYKDSLTRENMPFLLNKNENVAFDNIYYEMDNTKHLFNLSEPKYDSIFVIRDISTVDDSTISVTYKIPNTKSNSKKNKTIYYIDFWRKTKNGFICVSKDNKISTTLDSNKLLTFHSQENVQNSFLIDMGKFVTITTIPFQIQDMINNKLTYKQFLEKQEEYYIENPQAFSIFLYKLNDEFYNK